MRIVSTPICNTPFVKNEALKLHYFVLRMIRFAPWMLAMKQCSSFWISPQPLTLLIMAFYIVVLTNVLDLDCDYPSVVRQNRIMFSSRTMSVIIGENWSASLPFIHGFTQGSVLGAVLFTFNYTFLLIKTSSMPMVLTAWCTQKVDSLEIR